MVLPPSSGSDSFLKLIHPAIQVAREKESGGISPAAAGSTGRHFEAPLDPPSAFLNSIPSCAFSCESAEWSTPSTGSCGEEAQDKARFKGESNKY